jgi:hypothetical protein
MAARVKMLAAHGMGKSEIRSILALPHDDWGLPGLDSFTVGREIFSKRVKSVAAIYFARNDPAEAEVLVARAKQIIEEDAYPDVPARFA